MKIRIKDKRGGRFIVDDVVLNGYGKALGPYGIAFYVTLCRHANFQTQRCWPSQETIADKTGMSRRQVNNMANKCERLGLIFRETKEGKYTVYTLLEPKKKHLEDTPAPRAHVHTVHTPVHHVHTTPAPRAHKGTKEGTKEGTNIIQRKNKYSSLKDITGEDLEYIAKYYGVNRQMVDVVFDRMENWVGAKGKRYKDYKRALMNWVSMEKQRIIERRSGDDSKRGIDARGV